MGNLQSERIFSEENRNSSFPTATTMGRDCRIHWASERQVFSSLLQLRGPEATPTAGKEELVPTVAPVTIGSCIGSGGLPGEAETEHPTQREVGFPDK